MGGSGIWIRYARLGVIRAILVLGFDGEMGSCVRESPEAAILSIRGIPSRVGCRHWTSRADRAGSSRRCGRSRIRPGC